MQTEFERALFRGLTIIEILLNLSTYIICGLTFYILTTHAVFHIHMIRLIKGLLIYYMFSQFMRLVIAMHELLNETGIDVTQVSINFMIISGTNEFTIYGLLRLAGMVAVYSALGTIVAERIYATFELETYEQTVSNRFHGFCGLYHLVTAVAVTYSIHREWLTLLICGIAVIIMNIVGYFMILSIEWFNKKRYRSSLILIRKYTLSERFQLQENIRAASLMKHVAAVIVILDILVGVSMIFSRFYLSDFAKRLSLVIFNYALTFYGYTFPLLGLGPTAMWHQIFLRIRKWTKITPSHLPEVSSQQQQRAKLSQHLRSFDGSQMMFSLDEEREMYFIDLKNHWNK